MEKTCYVYILTNRSATLYIGVTNGLKRRLWEHRNKIIAGFTKKYNINKLIYTEDYKSAGEAISREKQLKGWRRKRKMELIKQQNPDFREIAV